MQHLNCKYLYGESIASCHIWWHSIVSSSSISSMLCTRSEIEWRARGVSMHLRLTQDFCSFICFGCFFLFFSSERILVFLELLSCAFFLTKIWICHALQMIDAYLFSAFHLNNNNICYIVPEPSMHVVDQAMTQWRSRTTGSGIYISSTSKMMNILNP